MRAKPQSALISAISGKKSSLFMRTVAVFLDQSAGDDQPLQFICAAADHYQGRVAIIPLDWKIFRVSVTAQDAHSFKRDLGCGLSSKELGHAGFQVATLAPVSFFCG